MESFIEQNGKIFDKNKESLVYNQQSQYGYLSYYYSSLIFAYSNVTGGYQTGTVATNYNFYSNVQYGFYTSNNIENYYTANVASMNVSNIAVDYSGFGTNPRLIGQTLVNSSGRSLKWMQLYEIVVEIGLTSGQALFQVEANIILTPNYTTFNISYPTVLHSFIAYYL